MTERKSFKRRVRQRMSKTGESYTIARAQVTQKRDRNESARSRLATDDDRMSNAKLKEATGKGWEQWFSILDRWGAKQKKHGEITRFLSEKHDVPGWWTQAITVYYERARGLRLKHQRPDGFSVSASKTINVPITTVFDSVVNSRKRRKWLLDGTLKMRTSQPNKGARFDWEDGMTRVVFWFEKKGPSKTGVAMAHEKLPDADVAETMKAMWRERLADLKSLLEDKEKKS